MWLLHLAILSASLAVSGAEGSEFEVNNLLAIGVNDEKPFPFMEYYNFNTGNWQALRTASINITDYGVAMYRNRLLLIGGVDDSDGNLTNVVNEVDLLSGQIKTVNHLNQPRSNPSVAVVGEGKSSALYILGGKLQSGAITASVERWDESEQKWMNVRPMVSACEGAAVVVHKNGIYVMGGYNGDQYTDTVQFYNTTSGMWSIKWPMDVVKGHFHGVSDGRYIFIIGGFGTYSDPNSDFNSVDRYDPENDVWTSVASISRCSGSVGVNLLNGQLYAVGGTYCSRTQIYHENDNTWRFLNPLTYDRTTHTILKVPFELKDYKFDWTPGNRSMKDILVIGPSNNELQRKIEVYHPEDDYWGEMDRADTNTSQYQAAFVNDRLIIAGGFSTIVFAATDKVYEISLETGEALQLSSMRRPKVYASLVTVGERKSSRLYVLGGTEDINNPTDTVARWNPFTDTWENVSPMNIARQQLAAVQHDGNIYAIGGYNVTALDHNEVYLVDEDRWEFRAPMIHATYYCSAVSDGKYIYVVGGRAGSLVYYVQRYDSSTDMWKNLAPTTSSYIMGISMLNDAPVVFGGSTSDVVEIYDAEKDEWRKLAPMNIKRPIYSALEMPWKFKYSNHIRSENRLV